MWGQNVPFAQMKINNPGINFVSDSNFPLLRVFLCLLGFFLADVTQQLLIMEMFLITLISRVVYRRKYDDLEPPECTADEASDNKLTPKTILNGAVSEDGLPRV